MIMPSEHISFKDWSASLLTDFSTTDTIPIRISEENWKVFAKSVANSPTFVKAGAPQPESFANWREWGKMLYNRFG